jgi:uncharacterized protein YecE (DUF72 family)
MDIRIGTSGYSFADWIGPFYPPGIKKGEMLNHYVKHFPAVEINSTYYRIPHPAVMANIEKKSPRDFHFILKTPSTVTHERKDVKASIKDFVAAIRPIEESGKLKGLLAQFPYSFKYTSENLDYIKYCRELLKSYDLFVEFRHNGWLNRKMYDALKNNDIGFVSVDEPQLSGLLSHDLIMTTETAYIRLHGRNADHWWGGGPLRYDYDYSENELDEWKRKIEQMEDKAKKMYIFFNNCHLGQAVKNAREMMNKLNL